MADTNPDQEAQAHDLLQQPVLARLATAAPGILQPHAARRPYC